MALDIALTAVAKAMSILREFQNGTHDSSRPLSSTLLATAAARAPDEHSPAVKTLMDIDEALVSSDEPAKVLLDFCDLIVLSAGTIKADSKVLITQGSKTKGKPKAEHRNVSIHPEALQRPSVGESQDDTLDREIAMTSLLIEKFNAHSSVWEGMEVDNTSFQLQCAILLYHAKNSTRAECFLKQ